MCWCTYTRAAGTLSASVPVFTIKRTPLTKPTLVEVGSDYVLVGVSAATRETLFCAVVKAGETPSPSQIRQV